MGCASTSLIRKYGPNSTARIILRLFIVIIKVERREVTRLNITNAGLSAGGVTDKSFFDPWTSLQGRRQPAWSLWSQALNSLV